MTDIIKNLGEFGIIPVVKIESADNALSLAEALIAGDLPVAEITFRTDAAEQSIEKMKSRYPRMIVGAGTVLSIEQVKRAVGAGSQFIVAPGFNPRVVEYCLANGIIIIPGVSSASQIELAIDMGLGTLKFFPAEASGGISMIKSLSGPYAGIKFIPTGGINVSNIVKYLELKSVHACGGSWMVSSKLISEGNFEKITQLSKQVVSKIIGFGTDRTNNRIILECNNLERTLSFLKRKGFDWKKEIDKEKLTIVLPCEGVDIVLKN